jgi:1-acyl-sn-glycerol-3-phosphate acyltransferase
VTINKAAALLRDGTVNVGVYPEGTRSKSGVLLPFHNGVFKIAQKADCPVAVVAVRGTELIHTRTPLRKTDVYLDVLEVLPAEWIKSCKTDVIGNRVSQILEQHLST